MLTSKQVYITKILKNASALRLPILTLQKALSSQADIEDKPADTSSKSLNKAMKAYLEQARQHDEFMKKQHLEFQIGRRHLANMMGENPETFTQEDIDNAIQYLFPSGLYDKKARPLMKPPEEVFPQRKAAEFDETGRPHHFLFYTGKPNFFKLLFDVVGHMESLRKLESKSSTASAPTEQLDISGYKWISKDLLEKRLVEEISDKEYENFTTSMERLVQLPYSYTIKDFIFTYCSPMLAQAATTELPKPHVDEDGRTCVTIYECKRKRAVGRVTLRCPGTGKISINEKDIRYFEDVQCREQLLFPLIFSEMLDKVDIEAHVEGGGPSGQAGAIRWGISQGLQCFVDKETIEKMRIAGLLQMDYRKKERKKPGQAGARRKFTWKKR